VTPSLRPLTPTYVEPQPTATEEPTPTYTAAPTVTHTPEPTATPVPRVEIVGLSWQPVRVVNNKVYDGKVVFEAEGDKVLGYAELRFIPEEYPHLPKEAFPKEDPRILVLNPLDENFDERKEEFAVDVKDIIGGREYVVEVVVEDREGNVGVERIETPYIREFENLGKVLYEKGIIIGATYYPLYPDPHPWELLEPMAVRPLLGKYDVRDPIVIAKHIDWASGHGINCFFFSWGTDDDLTTRKINENIACFVQNPLSTSIKIGIFYEFPSRLRRYGIFPDELGRYNLTQEVTEKLIKDFECILNSSYSPKLLSIDDRKVVVMYHAFAVYNREILIEKLKEKGWFIIADIANYHTSQPKKTEDPKLWSASLSDDGWTTWVGCYSITGDNTIDGINLGSFESYYKEGTKNWLEISKFHEKIFIPSLLPGFINLREEVPYPLSRDVERFEKLFDYTLNISTFIRIDTFNEAGEATLVEPTREEGFSFLNIISKIVRKFLGVYNGL
jgi:hypothetical protein